MGWWDNIKGWGLSLYNNKPLTNSVNYVGSYSYKTVLGLFELANAVPKAVHSVAFHPKTRMVSGHASRIIVETVLPLVACTYANDLLQEKLQPNSSDDMDTRDYISIDTAIVMSLGLIQLATWAFSARKKMQQKARMAVLTMEAARSFNDVRNDHLTIRCIEEECSPLRFIQGSLLDTISYFATEAAISLIGYIPNGGGVISAVLSIHHNGRYIMTMILPSLCREHQVEMLTEYSEQAFALGLGHAALTLLVVHGIESITHVPRSFYETIIKEFMMVTTLCVAAHMRLPPAIRKRGFINLLNDPQTMNVRELKTLVKNRSAYASFRSKLSFIKIDADGNLTTQSLSSENILALKTLFSGNYNELVDASKEDLMKMTSLTRHSSFRSQRNPVALFQVSVEFLADVFILGLRKKIPQMLRQPSSSSSLDDIAYKIAEIWQHPYAQKAEFLLVPDMLRNGHAFIHDPLVSPNWEALRKTLIFAIENIEEIRGKYYVRIGVAVGSWAPEATAKITDLLFGAPKMVVKLVLKLMSNDDFMRQLSNARRKLECWDTSKAPEIIPDPRALEVREEVPVTSPETVKIEYEEPFKKRALKPENVIGFKGKIPNGSASNLPKKMIESPKSDKRNADKIIRPKASGIFFKNPDAVIRMRNPKNVSLQDTLATEALTPELPNTNQMS